MRGKVRQAVLRSPGVAGNGLLDLNGHNVRQGDKIKVRGSDTVWTVHTLGPEVTLKRRGSCWIVTEKVS